MKFLITGGAGFIGCNFAQKLLDRGDEVTIFDNLSRRGSLDNVAWLKEKYPQIRVVVGDIRLDVSGLKPLLEEMDAVFHLAGQVAVTTSVTNPSDDFEINARGTFNILEAIRQTSKKPLLIYASTNKVYGGMEDIKTIESDNRYTYENLPFGIPEDRLLDFHSPYGCSKGAGDQYVRDYARIYGLKTVVLRQSCIYGPRQFGIEDQGWVAWFTIASMLGKPLTIFGDGKQVRDVLYIDDLFNAWDLAVKNINVVSGQVFNVGGGALYTMSLLELLSLLEEQLGTKITYKFSDWRPGDQPVYISDIRKSKEMLGWEPKISVQEGVKLLSEWVVYNKVYFTSM